MNKINKCLMMSDIGQKIKTDDAMEKKIIKYLEKVHEVYLPQRFFDFTEDHIRHAVYAQAIKTAVSTAKQPLVLVCGIASPLLAMLWIKAGARHVYICENRNYLASIYDQLISKNSMNEKISILPKRFLNLNVKDDLGERIDVLMLDCIDSGLLGHGLAINLKHACKNLLTPDAQLLPRSATVHAQLLEMRTTDICGFDLSAFNKYRWNTGYESVNLGDETYLPLSEPFECFSFNLYQPFEPESKEFRLTIKHDGVLNAVAYWYELDFGNKNLISTSPFPKPSSSCNQALQYLNNEQTLSSGREITLHVFHDCTQIGFNLDDFRAGHINPSVVKASVPHWHFPMITDSNRNDAYEKAISNALQRTKKARVLDIGTGTGLLAMMSARTGAEEITACEIIPHMAKTANSIINANGYEEQITLLSKPSFDIQVPEDMLYRANVLISETVDHSLLGEGFLSALQHAHQHLLTEDAVIIPAAATVYAVGIELRTTKIQGFNFEPLNLLHLNHYTGQQLKKVEYKQLTEIFEAFHFNFYDRTFTPAYKSFEVPVTKSGCCNAVAFWYDLHLDENIAINTGPDSAITEWQQAVNYLDEEIEVEQGSRLPIYGQYDLQMLCFGVDKLSCVFNGIQITPADKPEWFLDLSNEEMNFHKQTKIIYQFLNDSPKDSVEMILKKIIGNAVHLGLDQIIISDFINQIGHYL